MYGLFGIDLNIENIYKLAALYAGDTEIITTRDLKSPYIQYLQSVHSEFPIRMENNVVVTDTSRAKKFASAFSESVINDLHQEKMVGELYHPDLFASNVALVERSLKALRKIRPDLGELFDLAVHSVVLCNSNQNSEGFRAHGGTTNKCIGLIWLNVRPDTSEINVIEMLVHELTHTLVFLDELNYGHFIYENITKSDFWAISSILKRRRPMDKVIHSILVSMELLYARSNFLPSVDETELLHPTSQDLFKNIQDSIDSVLSHPRLEGVCKPRAIELVRKAQLELNQIQEVTHA